MDQAGGVCTSRDAQASGISRLDLARYSPLHDPAMDSELVTMSGS